MTPPHASRKTRRRRIRTTATTIFATVVLSTAPVSAGQYLNTIDDTARLAAEGRAVRVTVILGCEAGERALVGVRVSQGHVAAVGRKATRCSETTQRIPITVAARGDRFVTGDAHAQAWVELRHGQHRHPRHRWSEDIKVT